MKLIHKQVYELPDFAYFRDILGWDFVDNMEDVIENLQSYTEEDLNGTLGFPDEYYEVK